MKNKLIIILLIVLCFVAVLTCIIPKNNLECRKNIEYLDVDPGILPKTIWTYWDDPSKLPKTVEMCLKGWSKHNPEYEITLLTKSNYKQYVDIPDHIADHPNFHDNPTRFADLVRVWTLAQNGGVWIDSSIILKAPLDDWLFPRPAEFSGFYIEGFTRDDSPPVIENWFFACTKNSKFVKLWRDEFSQIAKYSSVEKYVNSRKKLGVKIDGIMGQVYLAMHVSAQKILQINKYPLDRLILKKAEDGPLKYLSENEWNSDKAINFACKNRQYQSPIMKIRSCDRKILEPGLDSDLSAEICGWLD